MISTNEYSHTEVETIYNGDAQDGLKPLILDELREMVDKPVFLVTKGALTGDRPITKWEIFVKNDAKWYYFTRRNYGFNEMSYGKTWVVYRSEPKEIIL